MQVADRCTVLRKGKCIGTVDIRDTNPEKLSAMMVGRDVNFVVEKEEAKPGEVVLDIKEMCIRDSPLPVPAVCEHARLLQHPVLG